MIRSILLDQFTCLAVLFHNLSPDKGYSRVTQLRIRSTDNRHIRGDGSSEMKRCPVNERTHMPYGITHCYLQPSTGDIPTFTPLHPPTKLVLDVVTLEECKELT